MRLVQGSLVVLSAAAGYGFGSLLPHTWGFTSPYGLMIGSAIYLLCFHPFLREIRAAGADEARSRASVQALLPGLLLRAALLLTVNAAFLYVRYGMSEPVDLTWPLATLASWSLAESWSSRKSAARAADWMRGSR